MLPYLSQEFNLDETLMQKQWRCTSLLILSGGNELMEWCVVIFPPLYVIRLERHGGEVSERNVRMWCAEQGLTYIVL